MALPDLALLKKHVNADDITADDMYLQHLLDTAVSVVLGQVNRTLPELEELGGGEVPLPAAHAVLMLAAHWYNQREVATTAQMHAVPYAVDTLLMPLRRLV